MQETQHKFERVSIRSSDFNAERILVGFGKCM